MSRQPFLFRPSILLRIEGLLVLSASCIAYGYYFLHHWVLFACLLLVPDVSLLPFASGPGAWKSALYNAVHSYILPALLGTLALYLGQTFLEQASLIWISHIGLDRMLGFGLKYPTSFKFTHIQSAANPGPLTGK
jgi:hypothetical protein